MKISYSAIIEPGFCEDENAKYGNNYIMKVTCKIDYETVSCATYITYRNLVNKSFMDHIFEDVRKKIHEAIEKLRTTNNTQGEDGKMDAWPPL